MKCVQCGTEMAQVIEQLWTCGKCGCDTLGLGTDLKVWSMLHSDEFMAMKRSRFGNFVNLMAFGLSVTPLTKPVPYWGA